jgi:hypothetical protein
MARYNKCLQSDAADAAPLKQALCLLANDNVTAKMSHLQHRKCHLLLGRYANKTLEEAFCKNRIGFVLGGNILLAIFIGRP